MKNNFDWFLEGYRKILDSDKDIYCCTDYITYENSRTWHFLLPKREINNNLLIVGNDLEILKNYEKMNNYRQKLPVDLIGQKKVKVEIPSDLNKLTLDLLLKEGFC